jgi:F-box interacting protein
VRVLSFGDSVWRNIEIFPVLPLHLGYEAFEHNAVFLNGTLNWLAIPNNIPNTWSSQLTVEQLIIVSLDLGTETYNIYTLPRGFAELPPEEPTVRVLGDCLCFSYYSYNQADLIIWQMKKFGDEESWTQFLKISFHDLQTVTLVMRCGSIIFISGHCFFLSMVVIHWFWRVLEKAKQFSIIGVIVG